MNVRPSQATRIKPQLLWQRSHSIVQPDPSSRTFPSFTFSTVVPVNSTRVRPRHPRLEPAHQEVAEGRPVARAAAFGAADDVVAFRDQVRGAPEFSLGTPRGSPS